MDNHNISKIDLKKIMIRDIDLNLDTFKYFDIYESLQQPGITGNISFADFQGMKEIGGIFAGDEITFEFGTDEQAPITLKYKIISSDGDYLNEQNTFVTSNFGFCSEWFVDAITRQVSKPYTDKFIHEIVEDLLKECGAKIGIIEPTKQKLENFVSPLWTPIHTIRHLLSFAKNTTNIGGYIIWTDLLTDKVNVTTVDYLYKGTLGTYESFEYRPGNIRYEGKIFNLQIEQNFDITRFINLGMGKQRLYSFFFDKNKVLETKESIKEYKQTHLAKKFPINKKYLEKKYWTNKFCSLYPSKADMVEETELDDYREGRLWYDYSMLFSDIFKINIQAPGVVRKRFVGWLANLNMPSQNRNEQAPDALNEQFAGKYLIRDIRHSVSRDGEYFQLITLAGDGYRKFDNTELTEW